MKSCKKKFRNNPRNMCDIIWWWNVGCDVWWLVVECWWLHLPTPIHSNLQNMQDRRCYASDYKSKLCLLISAAYLSCSFHIDQSYSCGWSSSLFCSTFLSFATQPPWIIRHGVDWRRSTLIKWTGWTLAMALPWWQHHKHCLGYYYYRCWSALSEYWNCLSHTHLKSN